MCERSVVVGTVRLKVRGLARALVPAALLALALSMQILGQEAQLLVESFPVGVNPLGVAVAGPGLKSDPISVVVANSGSDSVSIFQVTRLPFGVGNTHYDLRLSATVNGIPSPHAVVNCFFRPDFLNRNHLRGVLVTSPTDNSVTLINVPGGEILAKITVGAQPHAAACFENIPGYPKILVSNAGDDSLVIVNAGVTPDGAFPSVEATIPGVAGARGVHGIWITRNEQSHPIAWVAGTNADVVTLVDLTTYQVLTRVPVRSPTSLNGTCVASAPDGTVTCYDLTLQVIRRFTGVPSPQDSVSVSYEIGRDLWFFPTGPNNSVAYILAGEEMRVIPGIPGALASADYPSHSSFFVVVTSPDSNSIFLIQKVLPPPAPPREFSMVNGASFGGTSVAPNSLASLFLATRTARNFVVDSLPLPRTLGGVMLRVGGSLTFDLSNAQWNYSPTGSVEAPLLFVGPSQVNFQIPPEIRPGDSVPAQLVRADGTMLLTTLSVVPAAPGVFTIFLNGLGQAAVLNQDNSLNGDPQLILGARPAARGSVIQIFATGAGETDPPLVAGEPAPANGDPLVFTQVQPTVMIGGIEARVLFSGMAPGFVGLWQINAEVPPDVTPGPTVLLTVTADGVASNTVTTAVN